MFFDSPSSAKDKVLAWVRSNNPATMEAKLGCYFLIKEENGWREHIQKWDDEWVGCADKQGKFNFQLRGVESYEQNKIVECSIGSDMGLQELLIALKNDQSKPILVSDSGYFWTWQKDELKYLFDFDLTQNLHNQSQEFYEEIAKLIPTSL